MAILNKFILKSRSKDGEFEVNLFQKSADKDYLANWVKSQCAKLLTLDGTLGGKNGTMFDYLSTDTTAQDDWHIGKKYNEQSWFRFPVLVMQDSNDKTCIYTTTRGNHNAYVVVSKKELRGKSKNLMRAKTDVLEKIANDMFADFIKTFNNITNGNIYDFQFVKGDQKYGVNDVCKEFKSITPTAVLSNPSSLDSEFDELLEEILLN